METEVLPEIPTLKLPYDDFHELLSAVAATLDCARWTDTYHKRLANAYDKIKMMEMEFNGPVEVSEDEIANDVKEHSATETELAKLED